MSPLEHGFQSMVELYARPCGTVAKSSCSQWALAHRVMGEPISGKYAFKYHPWCKEIHDCTASFITAKKSAQAGFTEIAINRALYTLDILKRDVLYVLPTKTPDAADFSSARFGAALALSPYIQAMFLDTNKIELKRSGSANLYIRGSNSESGLKSIPVSVLILDEYDEMREKSIELALERLSGQFHKTVFSLSTPTVPGKGIDDLYQKSTKEHFFFACPHCNRTIEFAWPESVIICGDSPNDPAIEKSHFICSRCKALLTQEDKHIYLANGIWQPTVSGVGKDHRGFHINQMYSSTVKPADMVRDYLEGMQSEIAYSEFKNSKLGEAYIGANAQVTDESIDTAIQKGTTTLADRPPRGNKIRSMGIDQGKLHSLVVLEWDYPELTFDLNAYAFARVLYCCKVAENDFEFFDKMMYDWQPMYCVMDADPNKNDATRFARRFQGHVSLCRYRQGPVGKEIQESDNYMGVPIYVVDRTAWMDATLGRFHRGRISLPKDIPASFRDEIKSPARTWEYDRNNNPVARYIKTSSDDFAHALTYAEIALPFAASISENRNIGAFL